MKKWIVTFMCLAALTVAKVAHGSGGAQPGGFGNSLLVELDDKALIDSETDNLNKYYTDAVHFDEPITHDHPQGRGSLGPATTAIWVQGLGFVHGPLDPGEHVLHLCVDTGFGFDNTWDIVVE